MQDITIPPEHWNWKPTYSHEFDHRPGWEAQLRRRITEQPDPAKRFEVWLLLAADGKHHGAGGIRLWFIEQPYLSWALAVERAIGTAEAELRKQLAYEIEHPNDDCNNRTEASMVIANDMERRALEYIRNAGGTPEVAWFDDDHEPIGQQLREAITKKRLANQFQDDDGKARLELTEDGMVASMGRR
jgi:hypothetical protein